jgi:soluble lytic murein transglycosylase
MSRKKINIWYFPRNDFPFLLRFDMEYYPSISLFFMRFKYTGFPNGLFFACQKNRKLIKDDKSEGLVLGIMHMIPDRIYRLSLSILLVITFIATMSRSGICEIYYYIDKNGVMNFTNAPASASVRYKEFFKESPIDHSDSTEINPPPSFDRSSFDRFITRAAKQHGISEPLLKAIIKAESNFNPQAVSKKGAMGLMQIMPNTLKDLNINDPFDPEQNIMGGARYMKFLMKRFEGNLRLAIAAYNAGPENVAKYNNIPPFKETENYVKRVLTYYKRYN